MQKDRVRRRVIIFMNTKTSSAEYAYRKPIKIYFCFLLNIKLLKFQLLFLMQVFELYQLCHSQMRKLVVFLMSYTGLSIAYCAWHC